MISQGRKDQIEAIADKFSEGCLRTSVADSLPPTWRKDLTEKFSVNNNRTVVAAIPVKYGRQWGWFSVIREIGVDKVDFWAPELRNPNNSARKCIDGIQSSLSVAVAPGNMRVRGIVPFEWLAQKGMSRAEIARIRR